MNVLLVTGSVTEQSSSETTSKTIKSTWSRSLLDGLEELG